MGKKARYIIVDLDCESTLDFETDHTPGSHEFNKRVYNRMLEGEWDVEDPNVYVCSVLYEVQSTENLPIQLVKIQ